jgi:hypothetical protein
MSDKTKHTPTPDPYNTKIGEVNVQDGGGDNPVPVFAADLDSPYRERLEAFGAMREALRECLAYLEDEGLDDIPVDGQTLVKDARAALALADKED